MNKSKKWVVGGILTLVLVSLIAIAMRMGVGAEDSASGAGQGPNTIAVVRVEGMITGSSGGGGLLGVTSGGPKLLETLRRIQTDKTVKAVVLRVNSPGGTAAASQEIGDEIARIRQSGKVVVTSMGDVAASGGYWIAAKSDKIVANAATTTGSIGVIIDIGNLMELYQKIGYRSEVFKSGAHKDMMSPSREMTPEERQILKTIIDDIYNQFVDVVAEGRKMPKEKVRALADGRIYTGRQAKELGLVDQLGNYYDAIDLAAQLAGIEGKPSVREYGKDTPFEKLFSELQSRFGGSSAGWHNSLNSISPDDVARLIRLLETKQALP